MSLIIRLKNTTFGNTGLPVLAPTVQGFPADGLIGLYLLEEGTNGQAYTGTFADSSGNGNTATRRGNWSAPTKQSYGMQATGSNGLCIQTPILMTPNLSWIFVGRHTQATVTGNGYPAFVGPSGAIGTTEAGTNSMNKDVAINVQIESAGRNDWGLSTPGNWAGATGVRGTIANTTGKGDDPSVVGVSLDNVGGTLLLKTLDAGARNYYSTGIAGQMNEYNSGVTDLVCFGCWRYTDATDTISGEIMLLACYNKALTEAQLDAAMLAAKTRVAARGVTF